MIFDALRRVLGYGGNTASPARQENEKQPIIRFDIYQENQHQPTRFSSENEELPPCRLLMPPDVSQIESDMASVHKFMEQQMRSMMGSFGFILGNSFSEFDLDGPDNPQNPIPPVMSELGPPPLNPRDEVLKPEFRSRSSEHWSGQDVVLDERLHREDLGSVIDELRPTNRLPEHDGSFMDSFSQFFGRSPAMGGLFSNGVFSDSYGFDSNSVTSSSTVTIYSNVNGHKSVEKIVRHPDGKIERTVITDDRNSEP